jgi:hypothetical protein
VPTGQLSWYTTIYISMFLISIYIWYITIYIYVNVFKN